MCVYACLYVCVRERREREWDGGGCWIKKRNQEYTEAYFFLCVQDYIVTVIIIRNIETFWCYGSS